MCIRIEGRRLLYSDAKELEEIKNGVRSFPSSVRGDALVDPVVISLWSFIVSRVALNRLIVYRVLVVLFGGGLCEECVVLFCEESAGLIVPESVRRVCGETSAVVAWVGVASRMASAGLEERWDWQCSHSRMVAWA